MANYNSVADMMGELRAVYDAQFEDKDSSSLSDQQVLEELSEEFEILVPIDANGNLCYDKTCLIVDQAIDTFDIPRIVIGEKDTYSYKPEMI